MGGTTGLSGCCIVGDGVGCVCCFKPSWNISANCCKAEDCSLPNCRKGDDGSGCFSRFTRSLAVNKILSKVDALGIRSLVGKNSTVSPILILPVDGMKTR